MLVFKGNMLFFVYLVYYIYIALSAEIDHKEMMKISQNLSQRRKTTQRNNKKLCERKNAYSKSVVR